MTLPIAHVTGRVGREPVVRETKNGQKVMNFSLAADRRKGDERGPLWINVSVWNDLQGKMVIDKGTALSVVGYLDIRTYENKEGNTVSGLELSASAIDYAMSTGGSARSDGAPKNGGQNRQSSSNSDEGWGDDVNEFEW